MRYGLCIGFCLLAAISGTAAESPSQASRAQARSIVEMDALVAEALQNNPELEFYRAEIEMAKAARKEAGQVANPELGADLGRKTHESSGPNETGTAWSMSLMQSFEWPGRIRLRKAIANHDIELAQWGYEHFRNVLSSRVRTAAYNLFAAQKMSLVSSEVAERLKALREVLAQRNTAGVVPLLETHVIEATELNAQRRAGEASLATELAMLELNQACGTPPDTRWEISPMGVAFRSLTHNPATLIAMAWTNNFELRMSTLELAQEGFRLDLARNERFPPIGIGPTYSEESVGIDRERVIGVGVSFPLPLWNRNKGSVESAVARQKQAEVSVDIARYDIQRKVMEAALTYEAKLNEMAKWPSDAIQHFKEAAEVADHHYRLGAVPVSTYVELQEQYLEVVENLLHTEKEAFEAAEQLEMLTGLMPSLADLREEQK